MTARLHRLRSLRADERGVSLIEFALMLPLLLLSTLSLFELVNYAIVRQQLSQLALQVADNAARIGSQNSVQTQVDEKQVNDLFIGADLQSDKLAVKQNGRIILSSLEVDSAAPNGQYIHWQRCYGALAAPSSYGKEGDGKGNLLVSGMGEPNARIRALPGSPAMFVEINYRYQPLVSARLAPGKEMREVAAMMVRDNRDTSDPGINPVTGVTPSRC